MKIITLTILGLVLISALNPAMAYKYTDEDKNMFYDAFLDGYFTEMQKSVNQLEIDQSKKTLFMSELKKRTNKHELINSSWSCIQKYPLQQIVPASVICTSEWTNKQTEKNKDLFELLK